MSQIHDKTEKTTFKQKLSLLIQKNRFILMGALITVILLVIGLLIYNSVQLKSLEKYTREIELIQENFETLLNLTGEEEKEEARKEIEISLDSLIEKNKRNYALQRALFIRGNMLFQSKDWDKSIEDFKRLENEFSNSYLAPIALINAATAYEESGRIEEALEEYQIIIDKYSSVSPEISNIYFSIGRLFEQKSDKTAALEAYNDLLDNFPDSNWTNLARSRIIYLESR